MIPRSGNHTVTVSWVCASIGASNTRILEIGIVGVRAIDARYWVRRMGRSASRLFFAGLVFLPVVSWAIDPARSLAQLHHTSWTSRDGAPTDVDSIAQTDDGFLWFATTSGLVRFDGVQFEHYLPPGGEALPSGSIRSLLALPGNALLMGWVFGGVSLLRSGHVTTFGEAEGYPAGTTYGFLLDRSGFVWAATSSGLARFDGRHWRRIGAEWN